LLTLKGSDALAREFIFALADRFREQMGLVLKDDYALLHGLLRMDPYEYDGKQTRIIRPEDTRYPNSHGART